MSKKRRANPMIEYVEEYLAAIPSYVTNVKPGRLDAQAPDRTFRCCGGFGEHFDDCQQPCVYCGRGFDPEARWPRRRVNGANGYPAHSGCLEQVGFDAYLDRHREWDDDADHDYVHESAREQYDNDRRPD